MMETLLCPACSEALVKGFIVSPYPFFWYAGEKYVAWTRPDRKLIPPAPLLERLTRLTRKVRAYHCESCDLFLIYGRDIEKDERSKAE